MTNMIIDHYYVDIIIIIIFCLYYFTLHLHSIFYFDF